MIPSFARRHWLHQVACGFGALAWAGMQTKTIANPLSVPTPSGPLTPREPMFPARAKRIIFIFMQGGPSHVDTFDYKPELARFHGKKMQLKNARKLARNGMSGEEELMQSQWPFKQYGECGRWVSDLFPEIAQHVDDLCFIHSMHTNGVAHGPSTLFLHTGATNFVRPSMGSWVMYGLGTENQNLPGFITICPSAANGGPRNYANAFLPAHYQGTAIGRAEQPATGARFQHLDNPLDTDVRRQQFDLLQAMNAAQVADEAEGGEMRAVLESYELAWRMQQHAPDLTDLSQETAATLASYGIGQKETDDFGRQCLLARRMAEAGVRFVQVNYSDNGSNPRWDQHSNIHRHQEHAKATDKPVAALLADLKQRGLLEDTLVWWGGEFGRTPFTQGNDGRDHNPRGFTHFLAGAGVKAGFAYGATDPLGNEAVENKVHMHDLHATLLHLLGIDHLRLTYRYAGRDFRLTDVHGQVVQNVLKA